MSDTVARLYAFGEQGLREPARAVVELGVRKRASAVADGRDLGPTGCVLADDVSDAKALQDLH
jgi:hypothetical protein